MNVKDLKERIQTLPVGTVLELSTSQYVNGSFDGRTSASAIRSLEKQGLITADWLYRYAEVTVL